MRKKPQTVHIYINLTINPEKSRPTSLLSHSLVGVILCCTQLTQWVAVVVRQFSYTLAALSSITENTAHFPNAAVSPSENNKLLRTAAALLLFCTYTLGETDCFKRSRT